MYLLSHVYSLCQGRHFHSKQQIQRAILSWTLHAVASGKARLIQHFLMLGL